LLRFDSSGVRLTNPFPVNGISENPAEAGGIILEGTPTSAESIFNSVDAPTQAVAALFDHLSEKYPDLEESVLWRLAKVGTFVAIDVPLMVAAHEMGHAGAGLDKCPDCSPTVVMTGWMGGYTSYNISNSDYAALGEK